MKQGETKAVLSLIYMLLLVSLFWVIVMVYNVNMWVILLVGIIIGMAFYDSTEKFDNVADERTSHLAMGSSDIELLELELAAERARVITYQIETENYHRALVSIVADQSDDANVMREIAEVVLDGQKETSSEE